MTQNDNLTQSDKAWQKYFDEANVLRKIAQNGYADVLASDLKRVTNYEPRLLAKQDTLQERPKIFARNKLGIFPTANGRYVIFKDVHEKSFFKFRKSDLSLTPTVYFSKVDLRGFASYPGAIKLTESQVIDFAFTASLIRYYTKENDLSLTIRGRTRSRNFLVPLPGVKKRVSGVQIEIDAGFESKTSIYLIEAKIGSRKNFHIRQLYYPYLNWKQISKKTIVPIFLFYTNSKYYFYEFNFTKRFGDLDLVRKECYSMNESPDTRINIQELLNSIADEGEPLNIPYPQANDLNKVIDTLYAVKNGATTKKEIAAFFEFDERQGDYYPNAARYLGFLDKNGTVFSLNSRAQEFMDLDSPKQRTLFIVNSLLKRTTFRKFFELLVVNRWDLSSLSNSAISKIVGDYANLTGTTPSRRASTVKQWFRWLMANVEVE